MDAEDTCRLCHRGVRKVVTEGGTIRELETTPHDDGNHLIVTRPDGSSRARVLGGRDMPAGPGEGYRIHRCPPPEPPGPACLACTLPMNRDLALLEQWTVHPCCEPEHEAWVRQRRRSVR